jgi:hypothetical protein
MTCVPTADPFLKDISRARDAVLRPHAVCLSFLEGCKCEMDVHPVCVSQIDTESPSHMLKM